MASQAQADWVLRVLGVSVGVDGAAGSQAATDPAAQVWTDAKEAVDRQLNGLYSVLRKTGLPVLGQVADEIENVLGGFRTGMVAALMEYDRSQGPARETARQTALKVVADYRARLPADKHVIAADTNPFGVAISIRDTLGRALASLEQRL